MSMRTFNGLFVAEGSSDMPIADIVERMFFDRGIPVYLRKPDFGLLGKVPKDVRSRIEAGNQYQTAISTLWSFIAMPTTLDSWRTEKRLKARSNLSPQINTAYL